MRLSLEQKVTDGFVLVLAILCGISVLSYQSIQQLRDDVASVGQAQEILTRLPLVLSIMTDAETGQRGYTITGDEWFLAPYQDAKSRADAEIGKLRELIVDSLQQRQLDSLVPLLAMRFEFSRQIVELRRAQGFEAARERTATGEGKRIQDRIRDVIGDMQQAEYLLLNQRTERARSSAKFTLTIIVLGTGLATASIGLALVIIRREFAERNRFTAELHEAYKNLTVAKEHAETADRLKSAFLTTMSHELRTPLNSVIGFTGILLQGLAGPLNAEQSKQLGMVQNSARHLLVLINDVLDLSKIEAGELKVTYEPFNLRAAIEKTTAIARPLADRKGLALRVKLSPEIAGAVSDGRRVEQILLNLLSNAVKFTERGEVVLTADVADVTVRMRIADTGMGIKPEDLATLFRPFQQIDMGLSRNHDGTGLGLTICRKLADLLGGDIRVESEWGKGSVFTFSLPLSGGTPS